MKPAPLLATALMLLAGSGAVQAGRIGGGGFEIDASPLVESCVGRDTIDLRDARARVLLDADDRWQVHLALGRRYPAFEQFEVAPSQIVLWHKPGMGWLYVTLLAHPQRGHEVCFTATFAAAPFAFTDNLLVKYFPDRLGQR